VLILPSTKVPKELLMIWLEKANDQNNANSLFLLFSLAHWVIYPLCATHIIDEQNPQLPAPIQTINLIKKGFIVLNLTNISPDMSKNIYPNEHMIKALL